MGCGSSNIPIDSSHASLKSEPKMFTASASQNDKVKAADDNVVAVEKTEEKKGKQTLTEEEFKAESEKWYKFYTESSEEVMKINPKVDANGYYDVKIRNAVLRFQKAYFELKDLTSLENISAFRLKVADIMIKTKFLQLQADISIYTYKNGWGADDGSRDDKKFQPMFNSLLALLNFSDCSDDIAIFLASYPNFLETMKSIMVDRREAYLKDELKYPINKLVDWALSISHNVSMRESNIGRMRELDFTNVLKDYLNARRDKDRLTVFATLAGIVNEEESEIINSNQKELKYLLKVLDRAMEDKFRRHIGWSCKELGLTVRQLSRNDANKKLLVDLGALELLVKLGRTGNDSEQYESVQAIWALCFNEENRTKVVSSKNIGAVDLLTDLLKSDNPEIQKVCNGALWTLRDAMKASPVNEYKTLAATLDAKDSQAKERRKSAAIRAPAKKKKTSEKLKSSKDESEKSKMIEEVEEDDKGHVFISYNWDDKAVLKRVRDEVKKNGFKVWMDIDQMGGSTLQAMAEAVENAEIVLLCMSQKYKNSPNCRAEAEYAYQKRKKIIPLKMERGYQPDGWLGFIVGARLYFEFSFKYPFEEKMPSLMKEIIKLMGKDQGQPVEETTIKPAKANTVQTSPPQTVDEVDSAAPVSIVTKVAVCQTTISKVRKWSTTDVQNWINNNSLKGCLPATITGGEIALLMSMRIESPDFFYRCLTDMVKVKDLLTMSKIVWALQDIGGK